MWAVGSQHWQPSFAFITACKEGIQGKNAYFSHLGGWSNTYTNFEMAEVPVEIQISRPDGKPIRKAVAHPQRKAKSCVIRGGKVYVVTRLICLSHLP